MRNLKYIIQRTIKSLKITPCLRYRITGFNRQLKKYNGMDFVVKMNQVNKAVSTLVMIVYEQDYRGTTLSMEAGGLVLFMLNTGISNLYGLLQIWSVGRL